MAHVAAHRNADILVVTVYSHPVTRLSEEQGHRTEKGLHRPLVGLPSQIIETFRRTTFTDYIDLYSD